jgi:hypothetical protein
MSIFHGGINIVDGARTHDNHKTMVFSIEDVFDRLSGLSDTIL